MNILRRLKINPVPVEDEKGFIALGGERVPFTVIRNKRRKRTISFTLEGGEGLRILAPVRTRLSYIEMMLQRRSGIILRRMETLKAAPPVVRFRDGENVRYLGHSYRLRVTQDAARPQGCRVWPRRFEVNIPDISLSEEGLREEVRTEIRLWMKKRAKVKLQKRTDLWARILGVRYRKLLLTEPERQWGSCNAQNVIRLNWRLTMAPLALLDYVAAHELCHVMHKNHGPRFWRMLEKVMPDYKTRRRALRRMGDALVL